MSNTRIYSIYKHNNNKCLLINITIINFYIQTKKNSQKKKNKRQKIKEKKKSYYVKFSRALYGLPTSR